MDPDARPLHGPCAPGWPPALKATLTPEPSLGTGPLIDRVSNQTPKLERRPATLTPDSPLVPQPSHRGRAVNGGEACSGGSAHSGARAGVSPDTGCTALELSDAGRTQPGREGHPLCADAACSPADRPHKQAGDPSHLLPGDLPWTCKARPGRRLGAASYRPRAPGPGRPGPQGQAGSGRARRVGECREDPGGGPFDSGQSQCLHLLPRSV